MVNEIKPRTIFLVSLYSGDLDIHACAEFLFAEHDVSTLLRATDHLFCIYMAKNSLCFKTD